MCCVVSLRHGMRLDSEEEEEEEEAEEEEEEEGVVVEKTGTVTAVLLTW